MDRNKLEFLRGTLDVLILKALVWGPLHGYAVTSLIRRQSDDALLVEEGTLYPALQRILREDWVHAEWGLSSRNRRVRIYRITASGRRQLDRERGFYERMNLGIGRVMRLQES